MYQKYKDRAAFFVVYIKEAHPSDGWVVPQKERQGISIKDPSTFAERAAVAEHACLILRLSMPCLVDTMDNATNKAYAACPDRVYAIGIDGKIEIMSAPGPRGFAPGIQAVANWLESQSP